jgi:hypothetical protein
LKPVKVSRKVKPSFLAIALSIFDETVDAHMASFSAPGKKREHAPDAQLCRLTYGCIRVLVLGQSPRAEQSSKLVPSKDIPTTFVLLSRAETICPGLGQR